MVPIILLSSGKLGYQTINSLKGVEVSYLFTDKNSESLISWAELRKIPYHAGNPRKLQDFSFLNPYVNDWIFSINYLFIIPREMIAKVENRALNIHGALLPKYRGRTPNTWAIINGETTTGISVHFISEEVDAGNIVLQEEIKIEEFDTGGTLMQKMGQCYPAMIQTVLSNISAGQLRSVEQDHSKATYFPKRTADDGEICWHWQRERIRNWVRAQTKPYPGAFTFCERAKITVLSCEFSDLGYRNEMPNGLIVEANDVQFLVKTPNGIIKIDSYDCDNTIPQGSILGGNRIVE